LHLRGGSAAWYAMAAWTRRLESENCGRSDNRLCFLQTPVATREQFLKAVQDQADRIERSRNVSDSFEVAGAESAPARYACSAQDENRGASDCIAAGRDRPYCGLLGSHRSWQRRDGNARRLPGFFTEADNQTGDWQKQSGYYWTGSFLGGSFGNSTAKRM